MPSTNQINSLDMLDASFHVSTQETLAKNQEDLQKEININNVLQLQLFFSSQNSKKFRDPPLTHFGSAFGLLDVLRKDYFILAMFHFLF